MTAYIALIRKEPDSDYGVDFPDFAGCVTAGRSLDEARGMAVEAPALHVEGTVEDCRPIPEPSGLDGVMGEPGRGRIPGRSGRSSGAGHAD